MIPMNLFSGQRCICGEGNGTPRQYSCLENPRDGGAWWAAIYGVAQSWTRLKRLSSSSSSSVYMLMLLCLFIPLSPSPTIFTILFCVSASPFLPCKQVHQFHFSRFHIFALTYDICFSLTYFTLCNRL